MNITGLHSASTRSFVLLAPAGVSAKSNIWNHKSDYSEYRRLIGDMQKLRGRIYLEDGAIGSQELCPDGRHVLPSDEVSWHLLTVDPNKRVLGCIRFLQHSRNVRFYDLQVSRAPITKCPIWGSKVRQAIRTELETASSLGFSYVETGGWAMADEIRGTTEALRTVLAIYAWSHLTGGALGISTATERNGSACILRRLGGKLLEADNAAVPAYFDPHYNCAMEIVRFDSRFPNPRYASAIEELKSTLLDVPVIHAERPIWQSYSPTLTTFGTTASAAA